MSIPDDYPTPQPGPSLNGPGGPAKPPRIATDAPWPDEPAPSIPGYQVLEEIGRAGLAVVYKARDLALNRLVAVKVLIGMVADPRLSIIRLHREARVMASLEHPHLIPLYEVGEHQGYPYLVMELAEGGDLGRRLTAGPLACQEAARMFQVMARAVQFLHDRGMVHRNLKPSKVLIGGDGMPRLGGFGMVRLTESGTGVHTTGAILGTPAYMAPEQARGEPAGAAADIHGLGATLYHALTGRPPFQADSPVDTLLLVLEQLPIAPRRLNPAVPRGLEAICLRCLEKRPRDRYASTAGLADDLTRFLADSDGSGHAPLIRSMIL